MTLVSHLAFHGIRFVQGLVRVEAVGLGFDFDRGFVEWFCFSVYILACICSSVRVSHSSYTDFVAGVMHSPILLAAGLLWRKYI